MRSCKVTLSRFSNLPPVLYNFSFHQRAGKTKGTKCIRALFCYNRSDNIRWKLSSEVSLSTNAVRWLIVFKDGHRGMSDFRQEASFSKLLPVEIWCQAFTWMLDSKCFWKSNYFKISRCSNHNPSRLDTQFKNMHELWKKSLCCISLSFFWRILSAFKILA